MFYAYILQSQKDSGLYIGYSSNLRQRVQQHEMGKCKSTRFRRPLSLIYYEAFLSKKDAKSREVFLKSGYGRDQINNFLKDTLKNS